MNYQDSSPGIQRGRNVLKDARRKTLPETFLEQLNDPLIFILFIAAAISSSFPLSAWYQKRRNTSSAHALPKYSGIFLKT